jgi:hypothetical protein
MYLVVHSNDLFHGQIKTTLMSSTPSDLSSIPCFTSDVNTRRSIALFCARALPKHTWINDSDRFMARIQIDLCPLDQRTPLTN